MSAPPLPALAVPFVRDRTTLVLYAALGALGTLQTVPSLATPSLREELGLGYGVASAHLSMFAVGGIVAGLVGVRLTRLLGRRGVLVLGLAGAATGALGLTAGRAAWATLLACLVLGGLANLVLVAVQAGLADHHGERRAVAFAESNVVASTGTTVAPLLVGGLTAATGSWRWGVGALALLGLAAALTARTAHVPTPSSEVAAGPRVRLPPRARAAVAMVGCGVLLEFSVAFWGATYLREVVGLPGPTAVTAMVCFFGAMLVGRVVGAVLTRTLPPAPLLLASLATVTVGTTVGATGTATASSLAALSLLGLGIALLFPLGLSLAVAAAPHASAAVSGHCVTAAAAAILVGPLVVGRSADLVGLRPALLLLPVVTAVAALLLHSALRAGRTSSRPAGPSSPAAGSGSAPDRAGSAGTSR